MKSFTIGLMVVFFCACGTEDPTREFVNPLDPNADQNQNEVDFEPIANATDEKSIETPGSSEAACLAGNCTLSENVAFNFNQVVDLTPAGCEQVTSLKMFYKNPNYQVFLHASCESKPQVYTYEVDASSYKIGALTNISANCNTSVNGVTSASVSKGNAGFGITYECKYDHNDHRRYIATLDSDGQNTTQTFIETTTTSYESSIVWNNTAQAYGVARSGKFFRYDQSAQAIGGPVFIASQQIHSFAERNGDWLVFHSAYGRRDRCSKISSIGTLLCHDKLVDSGVYGFSDDDTLFRIDSGFQFATSSFDVNSCKTSNASSPKAPMSKDSTDNYGYHGMSLNENVSAFLFKTKINLVVATFPRTASFSLYAESSVTGFTNLSAASMLTAKSKLMVSYIKDGKAYVSISHEEID